jgi:hypothetical protein
MMRMPISKVLRPILANFPSYWSRLSLFYGLSLPLTMLSAPFMYILIIPPLRTTTDILFLSEVNGKTYSNSNTLFSCLRIRIYVVDCVDLTN